MIEALDWARLINETILPMGVVALSTLLAMAATITAKTLTRRHQHDHGPDAAATKAAVADAARTALRAAQAPEDGNPTRQNLQDLAAALEAAHTRLDALERRLPAPETLPQITSVNEAVLAVRLEELTRRLARVEAEMMTPTKIIGWVGATLVAFTGALALIGISF